MNIKEKNKEIVSFFNSFCSLEFKEEELKFFNFSKECFYITFNKKIESTKVYFRFEKRESDNFFELYTSIFLDDIFLEETKENIDIRSSKLHEVKNHIQNKIKNSINTKSQMIWAVESSSDCNDHLDVEYRIEIKKETIDLFCFYFKSLIYKKLDLNKNKELISFCVKNLLPYYKKKPKIFIDLPLGTFVNNNKFNLLDFKDYFELNYGI